MTFVVDLQHLLFGKERSLDILKLESAANLELLTQNCDGSIGFDQADEGGFADGDRQFLLVPATVSGQLSYSQPASGLSVRQDIHI